ncbi:uncharacterized protein YecE (DUF72 family) [Stenotrophomonas sp. SORGH_AS 282]|nr:uncharacterized protein YecE (DUF72 family) [Stenotrophomonas sp. SORGH_AS_0282]
MKHAVPGPIHTGIGGWVFPAWRGGTFYPAGLPQREELAHASRQLGCIEINSTFYRAQKPAVYAQWREQTPPGFKFSAKAPRTITQTHDLAAAGARADNFINGITALEDRLGPLVWQFGDTHPAGAQEFDRFLDALPGRANGQVLRHALEVRNPAAWTPELVAVARAHGAALVFSGSADYPSFADPHRGFHLRQADAVARQPACRLPRAHAGTVVPARDALGAWRRQSRPAAHHGRRPRQWAARGVHAVHRRRQAPQPWRRGGAAETTAAGRRIGPGKAPRYRGLAD